MRCDAMAMMESHLEKLETDDIVGDMVYWGQGILRPYRIKRTRTAWMKAGWQPSVLMFRNVNNTNAILCDRS